jgi:hypothetical protein
MTRSGARLALGLLAVVLALGGAPAYAGGYPNTVNGALADCGAGHYPLQGHYTVPVLVTALAKLSPSDAEYSTCRDALEAAIRAAEAPKNHPSNAAHTSTQTSTTTTHSSTTPAPANQGHTTHTTGSPDTGATGVSSQQIDAAVTNGKPPQKVDGVVYIPGAITTHGSSFLSSVPDPILAVLAALIVTLGALGALAVRNIVRARRTG